MKKYVMAMMLVLLPVNLYSMGLQDQTTAGFDLGMKDYDGTSDNGALMTLKGRFAMLENLDLIGAYSYESFEIGNLNWETTTHDFEFGMDWNFIPKDQFDPFIGFSLHYITFGGDNDSDNTTNWTFRAGLEINLINNWSLTPLLSYNLNEDFENGIVLYELAVNKWFNESMSFEFRIRSDEDA
ncbi:MAG: outer membrane beta-barrel protein, partial [Candidatus Aureabacteria bacterium]|nr:outer membrane beta-barrel protein [Candidatus Auribacterota bacterium]